MTTPPDDRLPEDLSERPAVLEVLEKAPGLLAYRARIVVDARMAMDNAKLELKRAQAAAVIRHKEERNQDIIKAYRDSDPAVVEAEQKLIATTAQVKIAELEHEKVYNHFISARKVGGMDDAELQALMGSTIRGGVVTDRQGRKIDSDTGEIVG